MEIPALLHDSPLLRQGGFGVFEGLPPSARCQQLLSESLRLGTAPGHNRSLVPPSEAQPERGGTPARRLLSVHGGQEQYDFYHSPGLLSFLRELTGVVLRPSGGMGSYSFYLRRGDFLGLHRDVEDCEVAVITCLYDNFAPLGEGGLLCLYPERMHEPLHSIRATPERGQLRLKLMPGQTLVMHGGLIPHNVEPMADGQVRIISVLCFR
jgi:hypothetical protein